ncbi:hypothetical protein C8R43DRAFT_944967 [Mycena crocata]|nr:hypothetical protein C8R43DRAFT_944967 [Mycena crocata]
MEDIEVQEAYTAQQHFDGYAQAVKHRVVRKAVFDRRVLNSKAGEVVFVPGEEDIPHLEENPARELSGEYNSRRLQPLKAPKGSSLEAYEMARRAGTTNEEVLAVSGPVELEDSEPSCEEKGTAREADETWRRRKGIAEDDEDDWMDEEGAVGDSFRERWDVKVLVDMDKLMEGANLAQFFEVPEAPIGLYTANNTDLERIPDWDIKNGPRTVRELILGAPAGILEGYLGMGNAYDLIDTSYGTTNARMGLQLPPTSDNIGSGMPGMLEPVRPLRVFSTTLLTPTLMMPMPPMPQSAAPAPLVTMQVEGSQCSEKGKQCGAANEGAAPPKRCRSRAQAANAPAGKNEEGGRSIGTSTTLPWHGIVAGAPEVSRQVDGIVIPLMVWNGTRLLIAGATVIYC